MTLRSVFTITFGLLTLCSAIDTASAESPQDLSWQEQASWRLKAVYDRKEFEPIEFQPQWLPDSSGFTIQEPQAGSKQVTTWRYDVRSGERTKLAEHSKSSENEQRLLSPDGKRKLEIRDGNLFVRDLDSKRRIRLTDRPSDRDITYRNPVWSPNGQEISFVEVDRTDIRFRPILVPGDPTYPKVERHRYARVGGKIEALRVGVVDAKGQQIRWLPIETPEEGFYLGQVQWAGNSNEILVETISRFRDTHEFLIAKLDGAAQSIYHETNDAWAVGSHRINAGLNWIDDGRSFVVVSEKDGWRHAYRCSRDGKTETKLTTGEYDMIDRAAIDEEAGWYYFYASPENGTQKYLYRVPLDGSGKLERISPSDRPGTHNYDFSPDAKWAVHTYSTLNNPPVVDLIEVENHRVVSTLEDNNDLRERAKQTIAHPTEFVQIDIGDGVVMDASITKPRDFDESKKYPVFVYVYGEPYLQTVLDRWGAAQIHFLRVVADMGYIAVSIDNRGTPCPKGAAWRRSVFGSLGPLSTEDQAAAIKKLGQMRSYVDLSRVGIWGWSGGGSNTLNAMFRKPDVYHVGIAVVPKPQPWLYNAWFQEIYMRSREVNPEGYERSAPINFAEGLKGKLLIVTGSGETNTHVQIIEGLVDRLIELGKPFDYMVYPNRDHGLREGPGTVVHVRMLILRYLIENLPRGQR